MSAANIFIRSTTISLFLPSLRTFIIMQLSQKEKSEIVIIYSTRNYGGAYKAMKYAKQNNKTIIEFDRRVYS